MKNHICKKQVADNWSLRAPWVLLLAILFMSAGCKYYKVSTAESMGAVQDQMEKNSKYFILHLGENAWHLHTITLDNEQQVLQGVIEPLPQNHSYYLTTKPNSPNRYRHSNSNYARKMHSLPTDEIHLYVTEYAESQLGQITLSYGNIEKIEVYDNDAGANTVSAIFGTLGVMAGTLVIVAAIVAATKSSCPFVYVNDGDAFRFIGEMYGGAILPCLERHDYMPLPHRHSSDDEYQVKIANKLLERQYTNIAELIVVEHPYDVQVIMDKYGAFQTFQNPISPEIASSDVASHYLQTVANKDSLSYLFNDDNTTNKELSKLELTFTKPIGARHGKLILNARNSYWLDYIYGKFNEQFGSYFDEFIESQKKIPADEHHQWSLDQGIPLSVYVQTATGWEFVDYFNVIGPLAARDMVMNVDLSNVHDEKVRLKLECGFMFWEIDYAAMDFSENMITAITQLSPATAIDETGKEVSSLLTAVDNTYLAQPEIDNEVTITYILPEQQKDLHQSIFLHSSGYYTYIRDYKGLPNLFYLSNFKRPGMFTKFSKQAYKDFIDNPYFF